MSNRVFAVAVLAAVAAPALAQQYQGDPSAVGNPQYQERLRRAYIQDQMDYSACVQGAKTLGRCGTAPTVVPTVHQRPTLQQDVRVTDYYCVDGQIKAGQTWANSMQACTRYQPQQSIGGYGQALPDATERDILEAQTAALNAFSQCVKTSAPGTYCGPPP